MRNNFPFLYLTAFRTERPSFHDVERGRCAWYNSPVIVVVLFFFMIIFAGCQTKSILPYVINESPSLSEIEQAVNQNSSKIKALRAENATLAVTGIPGWANCKLAYESPNRVRVMGSAVMSGPILDMGSNGDVFWFWNKFLEPQQLNWCRVTESQNPMMAEYFPVDPSWLPEALGVVQFKPGEQIQGPIVQDDKSILVVTRLVNKGTNYTKRTYIEPKTAAIKRQEILDPTGDVLISVVCTEFQYDSANQVVLPKKMMITAPSQNQVFHLNLGTLAVNMPETSTAKTFEMPRPDDLGGIQMFEVKTTTPTSNMIILGQSSSTVPRPLSPPRTGGNPAGASATAIMPSLPASSQTNSTGQTNPTGLSAPLGQGNSTGTSGSVAQGDTTAAIPFSSVQLGNPPRTQADIVGATTVTILPPLKTGSMILAGNTPPVTPTPVATVPTPAPVISPPVPSPLPIAQAPAVPAPLVSQTEPSVSSSATAPFSVVVPISQSPPVAAGSPSWLLPSSPTLTTCDFRTVVIP